MLEIKNINVIFNKDTVKGPSKGNSSTYDH